MVPRVICPRAACRSPTRRLPSIRWVPSPRRAPAATQLSPPRLTLSPIPPRLAKAVPLATDRPLSSLSPRSTPVNTSKLGKDNEARYYGNVTTTVRINPPPGGGCNRDDGSLLLRPDSTSSLRSGRRLFLLLRTGEVGARI